MSASVSVMEVVRPGESTRMLRCVRLWCASKVRKSKEEGGRYSKPDFSIRMMCSSFAFVWVREVRIWDQVLAGLQPSATNWISLRLRDVVLEELKSRIWKARRKDMKRSKVSSDEMYKRVSAAKGWET